MTKGLEFTGRCTSTFFGAVSQIIHLFLDLLFDYSLVEAFLSADNIDLLRSGWVGKSSGGNFSMWKIINCSEALNGNYKCDFFGMRSG